MAAPILSSITCTSSAITVTWDQTVTSPINSPGTGFSVTVNGVARLLSAASVTGAAVTLTPYGYIGTGDQVAVTFDGTQHALWNGSSQYATSFTAQAATNSSTHASLLCSTLAANVTDPAVITVTFSIPVTVSSTGVSAKINNVSANIVSVVQSSDTRKILITMDRTAKATDTVTWSYSGGTWTSGTAISALTNVPVSNASQLGTSAAAYPLSNVIQYPITKVGGVITARLDVDLNSIDSNLCDEYGPIYVDKGGIFGISVSNPSGVAVTSVIQQLKAGASLQQTFTVSGHPDYAATAALDWISTVTGRIQAALTAVRTTDAATAQNTKTVVPA